MTDKVGWIDRISNTIPYKEPEEYDELIDTLHDYDEHICKGNALKLSNTPLCKFMIYLLRQYGLQ